MGIWDQLNTRTLFGSAKATAEEVNTQEKDIHLEVKNRALLADTVLINRSLMRDGLHIPGTGEIATAEATESGVRTVIKAPLPGEVWRVISMTIESVDGGSGSVTYDIYVYDSVNGEIQAIAKRAVTSPPVIINDEVEYPAGLQLDENTELQFSATRTSLSSAVIQVLMYRVR